MTPMIDVTFLLIIFFLVSSHLAKQENFTKLDLPTASAGTADFSDRPTLTVQVLATGDFQIAGQSMPIDQIRKSMQIRMRAEGGPVRIRIRTDRLTDYQYIASLLKVCSLTGNTDIVFAVYEGATL